MIITPETMTAEMADFLYRFFITSKQRLWAPGEYTFDGIDFEFKHHVLKRRRFQYPGLFHYDFVSDATLDHGPLKDGHIIEGSLTFNVTDTKFTWRYKTTAGFILNDEASPYGKLKATIKAQGTTYYMIKPYKGLTIHDMLFESKIPLTQMQRYKLCFTLLDFYKTEFIDAGLVHQALSAENIVIDLEAELFGLKLVNVTRISRAPDSCFQALADILSLVLGDDITLAVGSPVSFKALYNYFNQLFLIIDPTQLSDEHAVALSDFFKATSDVLWGHNSIFQLANGQHFRFKYPIVKRPRVNAEDEFRYECIGPAIGNGGICISVNRIFGTLALEGNRCNYTDDKVRLIKFVKHQNKYSPTLWGNLKLKRLKAKPPVKVSDLSILVMKQHKGIELYNICYPSDTAPRKQFTADLSLAFTKAILEAYLRDFILMGLLHRDIKLENILVDYSKYLKTGFVKAEFIDGDFIVDDVGDVLPLAGDAAYMAPEVYGTRCPNRKSEIFALGRVIAFIFMASSNTYNLPDAGFKLLTHEQLLMGIFSNIYVDTKTREKMTQVLSVMLNPDPDKRDITVEGALAIVDECIAARKMAKDRSRTCPTITVTAGP